MNQVKKESAGEGRDSVIQTEKLAINVKMYKKQTN